MKMVDELRSMIGYNERILYEGKPDKKCFIFESIFNPLLPFAIVWALFDSSFIAMGFQGINFTILPFMLLHMMPVWIYIAGAVFSFRRYRNTYYIVTDKGVYVSSGTFTMNLNTKTFAELSRVDLHRGIFDQMFNVGDVVITTNQFTKNNTPGVIHIASISDYTQVYQLVKKLQQDIYTDIMYPNDLRPKENHGYRTQYRG